MSKLEGIPRPGPEDERQREEERKRIRETAEHINHCRDRDAPPLFEIAENGLVFCTHDGKPITTCHQTGAEQFYWMEVEWGGPGLIHDELAQAFYTSDGHLAVSRDRFDLRYLLRH